MAYHSFLFLSILVDYYNNLFSHGRVHMYLNGIFYCYCSLFSVCVFNVKGVPSEGIPTTCTGIYVFIYIMRCLLVVERKSLRKTLGPNGLAGAATIMKYEPKYSVRRVLRRDWVVVVVVMLT